MNRLFFLPTFLLLAGLLTACGGVDYETKKDPKEGAFTLELPDDWKTTMGLERPHGQVRSCGVAVREDGEARIFWGDPHLPTFSEPNPQYGIRAGMNTGNPLTQFQPRMTAEAFFSNYVRQKYGTLPGFSLESQEDHPQLVDLVKRQAQEMGMTVDVTATKINFLFTDDGEKRYGQILGSVIGVETMWMPSVSGFITADDPEEIGEILYHAVETYKVDEQWQQQENQRVQQMMKQSQAAHQQRMAQRQASFNAHQNRMRQRSAAMDAQHQSWLNNQAIKDRSHEQFVDYIRGETTVTNGTQTGKVQSGYNNYYVDPNTGNYIGTDQYLQTDLSAYEHWKIKR